MLKLISMVLLVLSLPLCAEEVRYLSFEGYPNREYFAQILDAAMQASAPEYGDYKLVPFQHNVPAERIIHETIKGDRMNVAWGPAVQQLTDFDVITIPEPILNGLAGIRLLLTTPDKIKKFDTVASIKDLAKLNIGQHQAWVDADLIESNGVPVLRAERYSALMSMLVRGRFDGVPLGSNHILDSLDGLHRNPETRDIVLEDGLIIYYPLPFFFFVNKSESELAERLSLGLSRIKENGRFEAIFKQHFASLVRELGLKSRRAIVLNNPYIKTQHRSSLINYQNAVTE